MALHALQNEDAGADDRLGKHLASLDVLTRDQFDQAATLIDRTLQAAMESLAASAAAIRLMLDAHGPSRPASTEGAALRDLHALLANSSHLSRLAAVTQEGFRQGRETCEKRTEREIAKVVDAVARHRVTVRYSAFALTLIALEKARTSAPGRPAGDAGSCGGRRPV